jgi:hypothetical protein
MDKTFFDDIRYWTHDCPDCQGIDDDQYFCTTCLCEGGNGTVNVIAYLIEHPHVAKELGLSVPVHHV